MEENNQRIEEKIFFKDFRIIEYLRKILNIGKVEEKNKNELNKNKLEEKALLIKLFFLLALVLIFF